MPKKILLTAFFAATQLTLVPGVVADGTSVDIKLFQFKPKELEVKRGGMVTWMNGDAIDHSVTSGNPGKPTDAFDSDFFAQGASFSHTFTESGTFTYFCRRHPHMQGAVKVLP
jgi:plastocyanin